MSASIATDGSPDKGFGTDGAAVLDSAGQEVASALAIQPDGRIVVAGWTTVNNDLAVYRLTAQGKPDNSFDDDGARGIDALGQDWASGVALQPDGKIVVVGATRNSLNEHHPLIARFDTAGNPDATFGPGGWRSTTDEGELSAVAVQPDGNIVAAGEIWTIDGDDGLVYRYTASGTPDKTFAGDGKAQLDLGGDEESYALALQPDGKIVVGGWSGVGDDAVVWRLRGDGSGDPAFGERGAAVVSGVGLQWVDSLGVQADGKIVVVGERQTSNTDVQVTRLLGDFRAPQPQPQPQPPAAGGDPKPAPVVRCAGRRATIVGTPKRDVIRGTRGRDVIAALGGNDVVRGMGGNDVICGGAGKDRLIGGRGRDRLIGGPGRDRQTQ